MPSHYDVAVIAGSKSDEHIYKKAVDILAENDVSYDVQVISAHRNPEKLEEYIKNHTIKVYICVAGLRTEKIEQVMHGIILVLPSFSSRS